MPKYDPPYLKRPLVNPAGHMVPKPGPAPGPSGAPAVPVPGPSGAPTGNHTSATPMTVPPDALSLEAGAKGIQFGTLPGYGK